MENSFYQFLTLPFGYEVDKENSTSDCIKFKKASKSQKSFEDYEKEGNFKARNKLIGSIFAEDKLQDLLPEYGGTLVASELDLSKYKVNIYYKNVYTLISFQTEEMADKFKSIRKNVDLIRDFLMIDLNGNVNACIK